MLPLLAPLLVSLAAPQELVVADFEGGTWGDWVATGTAFGPGPAHGTLPNQQRVAGFIGRGFVDSYVGGDGSTGTLTSPPFRIERPFLNFRIGGGRHPGETALTLEIDGRVVRSATGHDGERLLPASFDVREFAGATARIVLVDRATAGWGHVNVDRIVQSDAPADPESDEATELAEADAAVAAAAVAVAKDPWRPTFHLLPAAQWLNDPNGLLYQPDANGGEYHVFFQHHPYGDEWGSMHWGHLKSRDLAHWTRLPIALGPSYGRGEEHCFSGSALHRDDGTPVLIYTSIGARAPEQWIAVPADGSLLHWRKPAADPVLTLAAHVDAAGHPVAVREWRDPYLFRAGGRVHCVCGGNVDVDGRPRGAVQVYRAENSELTRWKWLGPLFVHPDAGVGDIECPIFFPIGGRFALITSQGRPVDWFTGDLDLATMRFTPAARGKVDPGCVYAPSVLQEGVPAPLLFGWVDGFPGGRGWRNCLTLPRRLALDAGGTLLQEPASELAALREPARHLLLDAAVVDAGAPLRLHGVGSALEFEAEGEGEGEGITSLRVAVGAGEVAAADLGSPGAKTLHVFVDRSVVELYAGGRALTRVVPPPADGVAVELRSDRRLVLRRVEAWGMRPAFE